LEKKQVGCIITVMSKEKILVAFFSGTGCAKKVAETAERQFIEQGNEVFLFNIDDHRNPDKLSEMYDYLVHADRFMLAYVVHAVDAPDPVYSWLEKIAGRAIPTAVVSVSGGGEKWPNPVCRQHCIAELEKKGFIVDYEEMIVMPCNWIFTTPDALAAHLLRALPVRMKIIVTAFLAGQKRRLPYRKPDLIQKMMPIGEKENSWKFPKSIRITSECTSCGLCARKCPTGNISMKDGKPIFAKSCVFCFRCVYACPAHAMKSNNFMVLKKGFDIERFEKLLDDPAMTDPGDYRKMTKGMLWAGVRDYLDEAGSVPL